MTKAKKIDPLIQTICEKRAAKCWKNLQRLFSGLKDKPCPVIKLHYSRVNYIALAYGDINRVVLSYKYFVNNFDLMLNEIIPHELAHIADGYLFDARPGDTTAGHDFIWEAIMMAQNVPALRFYAIEI